MANVSPAKKGCDVGLTHAIKVIGHKDLTGHEAEAFLQAVFRRAQGVAHRSLVSVANRDVLAALCSQ